MKKILSLLLALVFVLSLTACGTTTNETSKPTQGQSSQTANASTDSSKAENSSNQSSSKQNSSTQSSSAKPSSQTSSSKKQESSNSQLVSAGQDLGNVITDTVELTISKDFIDMVGGDLSPTLTDKEKSNGFTDVKQAADGSLIYTIKKDKYNTLIADLKNETKNSLDSIVSEGTYTSISDIEYNDNFSVVTIIANKEQFENSLDSISILSVGLGSCMYQMYDIDSDGKCTVQVKDSTTGEIFKTETYPK